MGCNQGTASKTHDPSPTKSGSGVPFKSAYPPGTPKVYVLSDVHLRYDSRRTYEESADKTVSNIEDVNLALLKIGEDPDARELILLGDIFDFWVSGVQEPIVPDPGDKHMDYLAALEKKMRSTEGGQGPELSIIFETMKRLTTREDHPLKVVYLAGNHDDKINQYSLTVHLGDVAFIEGEYNDPKYKTCFLHGHVFDLFNRKFPGYDVPVGYYITRCSHSFASKTMKSALKWSDKLDETSVMASLGSKCPKIREIIHNVIAYIGDKIASVAFVKILRLVFMVVCKRAFWLSCKKVQVKCEDGTVKTVGEIVAQCEHLYEDADKTYSKDPDYCLPKAAYYAMIGATRNLDEWAAWFAKKRGVKHLVMGHIHKRRNLPLEGGARFLDTERFPTMMIATVDGDGALNNFKYAHWDTKLKDIIVETAAQVETVAAAKKDNETEQEPVIKSYGDKLSSDDLLTIAMLEHGHYFHVSTVQLRARCKVGESQKLVVSSEALDEAQTMKRVGEEWTLEGKAELLYDYTYSVQDEKTGKSEAKLHRELPLRSIQLSLDDPAVAGKVGSGAYDFAFGEGGAKAALTYHAKECLLVVHDQLQRYG